MGLLSLRDPATRAWKSAVAGFFICAFLTLILYVFLYLGAEPVARFQIARNTAMFGDMDAENLRRLIEGARQSIRETAHQIATSLLSIITIYWLLAALFRRRSAGMSLLANGLLGLALATFLVAWLNIYLGAINTHCDVLPYPHQGFQIAKIDECPSSSIFFLTTHLVSIFLLITSLTVRMIASRGKPQTV